MKKIAIVGANSSVGRNLIKYLTDKNSFQIVKMARKNSDYDIDLLNSIDQISIPKGVNSLILLAASMVQRTNEEIIEMVETNTIGPLKVCMAAKQAGVKNIIFLSSVSSKIKSSSIYYNYYGITKNNGEDLIRFYCVNNGINLCILRPSQIYGTDMSFSKHQQMFYYILDRVKQNQDVTIYGSHDPIRNLIHIDDVMDVIYRVLESRISGDFDIVGDNVTLSEIVRYAAECCNSKSKVIFDLSKDNLEDNGFVVDNRIREVLHKDSFVTIQQGIKRIYDGE